ncbi:Molybdenum cofactor biosynthesis protein MoaB [hydrothermal vent metagenome]|uniref:Molybdenum cofactor biosynthesis protein MoaB n=1 Tax=hydrothermal vent metagenome TaxID=652676 RepID=A0A1W1D360_9ZZZZ
MNFYALIIGTEILNGRREDKHFSFLKNELAKYNHELFATFIIKDDKELIQNSFELIKKDKQSVLFSFGGIGSTPDDLTREIAAKVFTNQGVVRHKQFEQDIIDRFQEEAYPHRIHMADIPKGASLIHNPINNMSGFSLEDRFFFLPGFPQMAHPMVQNIIQKYFSTKKEKFRSSFIANTSEAKLIDIMNKIPPSIELSSLPMIEDGKISVEISLSGENKNEIKKAMELFYQELQKQNISFEKK